MNTKHILTSDDIKAIQLRKHKALATGLFILMLFIYIACIYLLKYKPAAWIGFVKAFAEAAMVGALADWFAVTALFHYPMGIPIPHTNLIENSKKRIGDNLGNFVVSNFLHPATIRPYIHKLQVSAYLGNWLASEKNNQILVNEISRIIRDIIHRMDEKSVTRFITHKAKDVIADMQLQDFLANGLAIIMERGDHERLLAFIVQKLKEYITNNEELVRARVKEESHFLVPGFIDNIIAAKFTKGLTKYLDEIENDPDHKVRNDLNRQLEVFIEDLKNNEKWQQDLQGIKNDLLKGDSIQQYASAAWKSLQQSITQDLEAERSAVKLYLKKTVHEMAENLHQDAGLRNKIDNYIRFTAYKYILRNVQEVGQLISNTVGNWQGKELSNKLELEVGKDLQYIRINGTLVGGLMGLLIYTITQLMA